MKKGVTMRKFAAKRIGFLIKRSEMTLDEFTHHWEKIHAVLCQKLPGLRRYSINIIDRGKYPRVVYDGFSELWFDSVEAHDAAFSSPEGVALLADIPNFVSDLCGVIVTEKQFIWP